jgi:hypothetical protein
MSAPDDDALMAALYEVPTSQLDAQTRGYIAQAERAGSHVTVFVVRATGTVLVIGHAASKPSMAAIRASYVKQLETSAGLS